MEILIDVPPYLHPYVEWLLDWTSAIWSSLSMYWANVGHCWSMLITNAERVFQIPRNALVPLLAFIFFFWPILLSLIMTLVTAWAWIFWIVTSASFGLIQLVYVSYQFIMITCDIFGLSCLKTYSMLRQQLLHIVDKTTSAVGVENATHRRGGKSRRRQWRQDVEQAQTYERFLQIRIQSKEHAQVISKQTLVKKASLDTALPPPIPRNRSFSVEHSPAKHALRRNQSFASADERRIKSKGSSSFQNRSTSIDDLDSVVVDELGEKLSDLLVSTTRRLREARRSAQNTHNDANAASLCYLLSGVLKRNHLQLDDLLIENARAVAERGQYGLTNESRSVVRAYFQQVEEGLDWIAEAPVLQNLSSHQCSEGENGKEAKHMHESSRSSSAELTGWAESSSKHNDLLERVTLIRKMKQNMGRTALMLSGGGAQAMYHLGIIRTLLESKLYQDIKVISGTSGGSIIAAMCATKTPEELYNDICIPTVVDDFTKTGEQRRENIRWFPPVTEMAAYWLKHKLLVDSAYFRRTCDFYYSDMTFDEAFERTGKHVCITVSASRASGGTAQRLLLNHISTPHVTVASAVAASCALPGVMAPAKLLAKNSSGVLEPFEVDGVEWIDGSVQADLPFQRIATLFAVSSFIVSQTNFHVLPFLNKEYHPNQKSLYWQLFQTLEWDIRSRALKLSRLGLFPRLFGQDISKIFKQKYYGNLTIVPRFTTMQTFGLKSLSNPTIKDMEGYLKYGQIAAWPYLNAIRDMIRLEKALDDCLMRLEARVRALNPDVDWLNPDDVESIASSSAVFSNSRVRIIGRPPMVDSARQRESDIVRKLEDENQVLKEQVQRLRAELLAQVGTDENANSKLDELSHYPVAQRCLIQSSEGRQPALKNEQEVLTPRGALI